ncbi:MAG TPA: energy transducer TonB, partial [Longimicrobium sp.]|nr:energy transducer TonB [Longimicrobium sp.]
MRILPVFLAILLAAPAAAQQAAADSARVFELFEVEVMPRPQNAPEYAVALQQAYPPHLREAGTGGMVQVAFVVGADGRVGDVRVLSASDSAFGAPSVQALSLLRFSPAQVGGRPVAVRVEQPITWRVEAPPAREAVALPDSIPVLALDS